MQIENYKALPFEFKDNNLIKEVQKYIKIVCDIRSIYQVRNKYDGELYLMNYPYLKEKLDNGEIDMPDILRNNIRINVFDNMENIQAIDSMAISIGKEDFINNLFEEIYDRVKQKVDRIINVVTPYKSVSDMFDGHEVPLYNPDDVYILEIGTQNRINYLITCFNFIEKDIKEVAEYAYTEIGFVIHEYLSYVALDNNMYENLIYNNAILGKRVNLKTGFTLYFEDSYDFKTWIGENEIQEEIQMKDELKFEEGYTYSYNKNGDPIYYKIDENGKKKRISESQAMIHLIKDDEETDTSVAEEAVESETSEAINTTEIENIITAGDKSCYIYFSCKLTNKSRSGDIVSIGLITHDGNQFYGEINNYNPYNADKDVDKYITNPDTTYTFNDCKISADKDTVKNKLVEWLNHFNNKDKFLLLVGDRAAYEYGALIEFLGNNIPENLVDGYLDLNQDIATSVTRNKPTDISDEEFNDNFVPYVEASHVDRFNYISDMRDLSDKNKEICMNSALISAAITKAIHQFLWNLH